MAIIQGLLALLARQAGRILNTAFSWATTLLFGKVPENRQIYLSVIAFGSVVWLIALLGVAFPAFAAFLLTFIPLPEWVDEGWVRLTMLLAALLIPLIVGGIALSMLAKEDRPEELVGKLKTILKGYPYTLGLAVTLFMMLLFAPILKAKMLLRRWGSQHVAVIVDADDYRHVLEEIQGALAGAGWPTQPHPATWMLRLPTRVLAFFAGGAIESLVAEQLTTLEADDLEATLHPSDLVISGPEHDVVRARAVVVEQLAVSRAYMTWTKEGNELEDRLGQLWKEARANAQGARAAQFLARLEAIEDDMRSTEIPYEEWEVLFRQKLQIERSLLRVAAGLVDHVTEPADQPPGDSRPAPARRST